MCGIFGQITPGRPVETAACFEATEALAHRGPDGQGIAHGRLDQCRAVFQLNVPKEVLVQQADTGPDFFLGHRRLSVIDLAPDAFQPMTNEDGTVWVVSNGEIYNHRELRDRLITAGHQFRTDHSDTEVLVHGYEQWGDRLVDQLRGMFALAVLDLRRRTLFLARDRLGQKPLYYSTSRDGVAFASELKALVRLPGFDHRISSLALIDYLHHGLVPAPRTIYRQIRKLRAAERLTIRLDTPQAAEPESYWSPRYEPVEGNSVGQWQEQFEAELREAVRLRMASDVPLGAFLSGGLDSTAVTREMSLASQHPVETFSIGFHEPQFDESPYAQQVARRYATRHHGEMLSAEALLDVVPVIGKIFDEPFADSSAIPTYHVSQLARQHVTVALSGDGGDELLAGYRRYRLQHRLSRWLDWQPRLLTTAVFGPIRAVWPERARGKSFLRLLEPDAKRRYFKAFQDEYLVDLAETDLAESWDCLLEDAWPSDSLSDSPQVVDQMCATDCRFYIPEDLMVKVDRTSMSVSLETRSPLLDHKLFELAGKMPLAVRFDGRRNKLPLRRLVGREFGPQFVDRRKTGFAVPLGAWFRGPLRDQLHDTLLKSDGLLGSLLSRAAIETLIRNHELGSRDQSRRLWKLYMLQQWDDYHGKVNSHENHATRSTLRAA